MLTAIGRLFWLVLPLPLVGRRAVKDFLFRLFPAAFRSLPAYQRWRLFHPESNCAGGAPRREAVPRGGSAVGPAEAATVRAIAMYLPQFHRIEENDRWWGEGFSDWSNVRRGRPMYTGHHQPHVPHPDVGYYDLSDPAVLQRQAAMARSHGIHGFCFYYYWFSGRRLLEKPLERMLESGRPDFPFCICWANENWTRNWDGLDHEILISQKPADDDGRRFILDLIPLLRDPRYIRVDDRPLVIVYRVNSLPNPARMVETWRTLCRERGVGEIHLCSVRSVGNEDPRQFGFDSAMQFPPLLVPCENLAFSGSRGVDVVPGFRGAVLDYRDAMRACLEDLPQDYPVFRGVMPSWDNTARRMGRGTSWINSSPAAYGQWLREAVERTCREQPESRRLVFINAWNEWAEGAHLEPDERFGYAHLEETARALSGRASATNPDTAAVPGRREPAVPGSIRRTNRSGGGRRTWLTVGSRGMERRLAEDRRHVLFDLLFCQPGFHGGGEYGKAVFESLVEHASRDGRTQVWAAMDPGVFMEAWVWDICREHDVPIVAVKSCDEIVSLVNADRFARFFTPGLAAYTGHCGDPVTGEAAAVMDGRGGLLFRNRRTRIIGTVHDVIEVTLAKQRPRWPLGIELLAGTPRSRRDYARLLACDRIETIVTVSECVRSTMLGEFGAPASRLVVLTPPSKRRPEPVPICIGGRHLDSLDFALIVNAGRPEKNAATAVAAFDSLFGRRELPSGLRELQVLVVGIDTLADLKVDRLRHPQRFVALPMVSAEHYEHLLSRVRFLVYPSFEEGFGYPPVEAMRFGVPSVASECGAIREVCGNAAIYCDPYDHDSIAAAILRMYEQPVDRDTIEDRLRFIAGRQRDDLGRLVQLICGAGSVEPGGAECGQLFEAEAAGVMSGGQELSG
jgi:glycosyltransferase involved in cell wall biosynthesis